MLQVQLLTFCRPKQRFQNSVNPKGPYYSPRQAPPPVLTALGEPMVVRKLPSIILLVSYLSRNQRLQVLLCVLEWVDTDMQKQLREVHSSMMDKMDNAKFLGLHESGKLLKPEQPGHVIAKMVLDPPTELNGQYIDWEGKEVARFQ